MMVFASIFTVVVIGYVAAILVNDIRCERRRKTKQRLADLERWYDREYDTGWNTGGPPPNPYRVWNGYEYREVLRYGSGNPEPETPDPGVW